MTTAKNMMISLTAKQLNPRARVVARCHEMRNVEKLKKAGADHVVLPDFTGGMRIVTMMVRPHVASFLEEMQRSEHKIRMEEEASGHRNAAGGTLLMDMDQAKATMIQAVTEELADS